MVRVGALLMDCWLAQFAPQTPCDGPMQRCHLVSKQALRREVWDPVHHSKQPKPHILAERLPATYLQLHRDPRTWVPGCERHHHMLDFSFKLRIPRERLPEALVTLCEELGLMWWLERRYETENALSEPAGARPAPGL